MLVNERYLNGTDADIQLAKKLILIDSKVRSLRCWALALSCLVSRASTLRPWAG